MARALESREFRAVIKAEIAKRFDGDYDALFKNICQKKLSDGVSFVEHIGMAYASLQAQLGKKVSATAALQVITDAASRIPKFQIAIPVHFGDWDAGTYVPLVTYVPAGIDEKDLVSLKAYDSDGKVHWLDAKKAPNVPVVVLGINERTDDNGTIKSYLLPPDDGGGGGGGGGGDPVSRLTVNHFRCLDADWDGWFGGEPEFYISVYYHGIYQRTDFFDVVEEQTYWNINRDILTVSGPFIYTEAVVELWEEDGGLGGPSDLVENLWFYDDTNSAQSFFYLVGPSVWYRGTSNNADLYVTPVSAPY